MKIYLAGPLMLAESAVFVTSSLFSVIAKLDGMQKQSA